MKPSIERAIKSHFNWDHLCIEPVAGDASTRSYYRASNNLKTFIVMCDSGSLSAKKTRGEWIEIGTFLSRNQIRVPKIELEDDKNSILIIEDLGNTTLQNQFLSKRAEGEISLSAALNIVRNLLNLKEGQEVWTKRAFDTSKLYSELEFLAEKFLIPEKIIAQKEIATFKVESEQLSAYLSSYSRFFTHRDYHSRNLMVLGKSLAVIDFQDSRLGPPAYDLVSLCFDSYISLSQAERISLVYNFIESLPSQQAEKKSLIETTWRRTLLQRQLKAIGSFGYLTNIAKKGNYLKYLEPALETLNENVADSKLPFLSKILVERLSEYHEKQKN